MTDRHIGYIVTLEATVRDDDAESIRTALAMVKGVEFVQPIVADPQWAMAQAKARNEVVNRLRAMIRELLS